MLVHLAGFPIDVGVAHVISFFIAMILSWVVWDSFFRFPSNFPPSPRRLPFLGSLMTMAGTGFYDLNDLSKKTGKEILHVLLANHSTFVVSSDSGLKKMLSSHFVDRPLSEVVNIYTKGRLLFAFSSKEDWLPHRKLVHSSLLAHNLKFSRTAGVEAGTKTLIEYIKKKAEKGEPFIAFDVFCWSTTSILADMIIGKKWDGPNDPEFIRLREAFKVLFYWVKPGNVIDFAPFLRPFCTSTLAKAGDVRDEILYPIFEEHVKTFDEHRDNPRDYLDVVLQKRGIMLKSKTMDNLPKHFANEKIFSNQVVNLLLGGFDTTATSIDWSCVFLANHPEIQEKLYAELREVCGDRPPCPADTPNLPYLNGVIRETLRIMPVSPMSPRQAVKDTEIDGFKVKNGTVVFPNLYRLHHNPKYWKDPETFDPERFISSDEGKSNEEKGRYLPFGGGPRECVGRALAEEEYFEMLSNIVYHFSLHSVDGKPMSIEAKPGIVVPTQRVPMLFKLRK